MWTLNLLNVELKFFIFKNLQRSGTQFFMGNVDDFWKTEIRQLHSPGVKRCRDQETRCIKARKSGLCGPENMKVRKNPVWCADVI